MMQLKTPDGALAREVLELIENDRDAWHQDVWATECGTAGCYAYWTVALAGARFDDDDPEYVKLASLPVDVVPVLTEHFSADGDHAHLSDAAAALLGLVDIEEYEYGEENEYVEIHAGVERANRLFSPSNSLNRLRALVDELFPAAENAGS